ncbi:Protein CBG11411 [Caenorhabditis briggsae]|uniref:Decapping nuclease n=1 Tax=Caenorhabditis briggsae TaxID=6238 RepID=A8XD33_CAEBR|nr:Protein CBG11411 [Caenorhabditis briggsae]CAP30551.2 Protein CBG11411 [Caenorhabditis briggsae]
MYAAADVSLVGTFAKLADRTAVPGALPPRLNEDPSLYGHLTSGLDLTIGCEGYSDTRSLDSRFHSIFDYLCKTSQLSSSFKEVLVVYCSHFQCLRLDDREYPSQPFGHKFEQYLTLNDRGLPHDKYERLTNDGCSKAVFRTTFTSGNKAIKVFYAAEMDAIDEERNFVELKTTSMSHDRWVQIASLSNYLQSFFGKIPYIICGRKPSFGNNVIYQVDKIQTADIPNYSGVHWKKEVCFQQIFNVLNAVKSRLQQDNEAVVFNLTQGTIYLETERAENCTFTDQAFLNYLN